MTQPTQPRRRFAPIPVETTFKQRRGGPAAELTPEPSPTFESSSPQFPAHGVMNRSQETQTTNAVKRRFAPQLIESTRRSRRTGDIGPATRPVDKTDITPYQKHIYSLTSKKKTTRRPGHARRESCDDEISEHVFDLNKLDAQRHLEEIALAAFPNSGIRTGGAEHFYVREGSEEGSEDDDSTRGRQKARGGPRAKKQTQRDASEDDVGWAVKEMQQHHGQLARDRDDDDHSMTDSASARSDGPPDNTFAFTNRARHTMRGSLGPLSPIGEHPMPFIPSEPVLWSVKKPNQDSYFGSASYDSQPRIRAIGESHMPYIPSAPPGKQDLDMPDAPPRHVPASQLPPETGFANTRGAFGRFYGYENQTIGNSAQNKAAEKELYRLRTRQSPPMAGKDLVFRMMPSPKQTKLEPDQKWDHAIGSHVEPNRDATGENGLWRGYCYTTNKGGEAVAPSPRPAMIMTPMQSATPFEHTDPYANMHGTLAPFPISAELTPSSSGSSSVFTTAEHRSHAGQPKGLHKLMGLEQRLQKEKVSADLEEKIAAEFNDVFVTQVYNYLSLGYPAMARSFDDELSKISHFSVEELEKEDDTVMDGIGSNAKGHLKISMELDMSEDKRCPRWKALKKYIFEWARQHPDLDGISPLAWGVAERRGSWGI